MSRRRVHLTVAALAVSGLIAGALAVGVSANATHDKDAKIKVTLTGLQEVPVINTRGHASLTLGIENDKLTFDLRWADLSGPPGAAHIHVGQRNVNGGVSVFFCGGGGKPACEASATGSATGTIVAADVVGPAAQGFTAADPASFAALIRFIRADLAYANMHTAAFPGGEIRAQLH